MYSLFIRNLIFTILQPGIVAGLIPYLIVKGHLTDNSFIQFRSWQYAGIILFVSGLLILTSCIISFAVKGNGTLSPADPTKKLVVSGLYRYSRNPMYVGVMLILTGEAIFFPSVGLLIYLILVFIAFNAFIILAEEPRLRKDFGGAYSAYCERVGRWI